jgi:hypothetical protein
MRPFLSGEDAMDPVNVAILETNTKFPSGPWTGFFLQCWIPGRHMMAIDLTFTGGHLEAKGSDLVGPFTFQGEYIPADGKCQWVKRYLGKHRVTYTGVNEGQGIWGVWEIRQLGGLWQDKGVFHIWPRGMAPTEEAEATVQAYLTHLRSGGWFVSVVRLALGSSLGFGLFFLIRHLFHVWTGSGTP